MNEMLNQSRHLFGAVDFSQWTQGFDGGERVFLILAVIGAFVLVAAFAFTLINKIHRRNAELALKRDMLDRGMSVDEIERVLTAKPAKNRKLADTQPYTNQ